MRTTWRYAIALARKERVMGLPFVVRSWRSRITRESSVGSADFGLDDPVAGGRRTLAPSDRPSWDMWAGRLSVRHGVVNRKNRNLARRQVEPGRPLEIRTLDEQPMPRRPRDTVGLGDDRGLVQCQHA